MWFLQTSATSISDKKFSLERGETLDDYSYKDGYTFFVLFYLVNKDGYTFFFFLVNKDGYTFSSIE